MIIPIRCFECGKVVADKWRYYQRELIAERGDNAAQRIYFDGVKVPETAEKKAETAEKKVLDKLKLNQCCRTHFLTQVDLIDKI